METFLKAGWVFLTLICSSECIRLRVPIGIVDVDSNVDLTVMKYGLWLQDRRSDWPRQYEVEIVKETAARNNLTELDKAVCGLLKRGVYAIIAPTTVDSYYLLASYSTEYEVPLISPSLPEIPREHSSKFVIGIQPSTTRAVLDLIRNYKWEHLVYLYDDSQGAEKLQQIFHLGYSVLELSILGVQKAINAEQVNQYFRKLEQAQKYRSLHVILDMDPLLAKDIIIRHVHDIFVGKNNYHFLITTPVLEEFWSSHAAEFGAMSVTGFLALPAAADRSFADEWRKLSPRTWPGAGARLNVTSYLYHDAVYLLGEGLRSVFRGIPYRMPADQDLYADNSRVRDCLQTPSTPLPLGPNITNVLKKGLRKGALTGNMEFDILGRRRNVQIPIIEVSASKQRLVGSWSDTQGLHIVDRNDTDLPVTLPWLGKKRYVITTVLIPPFLRLRSDWNSSGSWTGNDRYEGYAKDFIELLAQELGFEYDLKLSSDGKYGYFDKTDGKWNGMVGEIISGSADIAVADIHIRPQRLQVVDFLDPFMTSSISVLMKNPQSASSRSSLFMVGAFRTPVWLCILASTLVVVAVFHYTSKFTGAPDTIGAASGVWSKKFTVRQSLWFMLGTGLFQGTGIYPRSLSCRVLAASWWCFILMLTSLFIASVTTQLSQRTDADGSSPQMRTLNSLTLEAILAEAVQNQWPNIGVTRNGTTHRYIQESSLPFLRDYAAYMNDHPEVFASSLSEGVTRVRQSRGEYGMFMESAQGDFFSGHTECDTIAVHDLVDVFQYGIILPLGSPLRSALNAAQENLKKRGDLNHLKQIWFHDRSRCVQKMTNNSPPGLYSFSGLLYFLLIGMAIVAIVGVSQYFWRLQMKNRARRNISFEEVTMPSHNLPLPPPELLSDESLDEDNGPIDGWAERKLVPTSFGRGQAEE